MQEHIVGLHLRTSLYLCKYYLKSLYFFLFPCLFVSLSLIILFTCEMQGFAIFNAFYPLILEIFAKFFKKIFNILILNKKRYIHNKGGVDFILGKQKVFFFVLI